MDEPNFVTLVKFRISSGTPNHISREPEQAALFERRNSGKYLGQRRRFSSARVAFRVSKSLPPPISFSLPQSRPYKLPLPLPRFQMQIFALLVIVVSHLTYTLAKYVICDNDWSGSASFIPPLIYVDAGYEVSCHGASSLTADS